MAKKSGAGKGRPGKEREDQASDEEMDLWRRAMKDARPLKPSARLAPKDRTAEAPPGEAGKPAAKPAGKPSAKARPKAPVRHPAPPPRKPPELSHGSVADMDKRQAERLKKGRLPIEGRLDLHAMTQAQARGALERFIIGAAARQKRCLLVITGKGRDREVGHSLENRGVLHRQVPLWLNQPPLRGHILSFTYVQPKDGGSGALYVLLRRTR